MFKNEIIVSYKNAKNKKKQVKILAELNDCSQEEIIKILREGGVDQRELPRNRKKNGDSEPAEETKEPAEEENKPAEETEKLVEVPEIVEAIQIVDGEKQEMQYQIGKLKMDLMTAREAIDRLNLMYEREKKKRKKLEKALLKMATK